MGASDITAPTAAGECLCNISVFGIENRGSSPFRHYEHLTVGIILGVLGIELNRSNVNRIDVIGFYFYF